MKRHVVVVIASMVMITNSFVYAAELFVSTTGNDSSGNGTIQYPFRTIQYVLDNVAAAGDTISLRTGTYNEEVRVRTPNITIRSNSGEWSKISTAPTIDPDNSTITVLFDVESKGSKLQRVEVTGGFYAVAFFSQWDYDSTPLDNDAAKNIVIEDCIIHDSGRDCIKLPAGCDDITIKRTEVYNSGILYPAGTADDQKNAEGIDVVNCDRILVQDCYIHDTATTGIYIKGGSLDGVIERTKVENCGALGISVGFDTSPEFFDLSTNPDYYENIRGIVRNCVVSNTKYAGIALYGSKDAVIHNNTVVNTAKTAQSPLYFGLTYQDWDTNAKRPANVNPMIMNNIFMQFEPISSPCLSVRYMDDLGGMSALSGNPAMNNNLYYKNGGTCFFEDSRPSSLLTNGTLSQWKTHIAGDSQSLENNPLTDASYHLTSGSPCIDAGNNVILGGMSSTDKDNHPRVVNGTVDIGAYEYSSGSQTSYTVTPQVGLHGSIVPSVPQAVALNATVNFTITPDTGYSIASASGCNGSLNGNIYTTGSIISDCTVSVSFKQSVVNAVRWVPAIYKLLLKK